MEKESIRDLKKEGFNILNWLLENKKQGLNYIHSIIDGNNFDYNKLKKEKIDNKKYGLDGLLYKIADVLDNYGVECDKLSLNNDEKGFSRSYLIKPFVQEELFCSLDNLIDNIYKFYSTDYNKNNLYPFMNVENKSIGKNKEQDIIKAIEDIRDAAAEYDFISNIEGTVNFSKKISKIYR